AGPQRAADLPARRPALGTRGAGAPRAFPIGNARPAAGPAGGVVAAASGSLRAAVEPDWVARARRGDQRRGGLFAGPQSVIARQGGHLVPVAGDRIVGAGGAGLESLRRRAAGVF